METTMSDEGKEGLKEQISSIVGDNLEPDEITLVKVKMKPKEEQAPRVVIVKNEVKVQAPRREVQAPKEQAPVKIEAKKVNKANTFDHLVEQQVNGNKSMFKRKGITLL
jgi:hypothetical protein